MHSLIISALVIAAIISASISSIDEKWTSHTVVAVVAYVLGVISGASD